MSGTTSERRSPAVIRRPPAQRGAAEEAVDDFQHLGASARSAGASCSVVDPTDCLSSSAVPSAITTPWSMTAIRSAS